MMNQQSLQNKFNFLLITVMSLVFASCEKVIDVDIEDADRKFVIEATLSNQSGVAAEVRISKTKGFSESSSFDGISNASVSITEENGATYSLNEIVPGVYQSSGFKGKPGFKYSLAVNVDGNRFTAESIIPKDTVSLERIRFDNLSFFGQSVTTVIPEYTDPIGLGNNYKMILYVNGTRRKAIFVQNDEFSDGLFNTRPLIDGDLELNPGDLVTVDLLCIDRPAYDYWYSLDQSATGENQSATPSNPVSNIKGGALGYFSAFTLSSRSTNVP
jgi:hypothetical protein